MRQWFGLDIGSNQVKVLEAEKTAQGFKAAKMAAVQVGNKSLAEAIKAAVKEAGIKSGAEANTALPESEVFTRIIETPKLSEAELASSIQYEAEQYIPVPMNEVELFHQVIAGEQDRDENFMKVLLIATPKTEITELTRLFDQAELIPKSLETELFSQKRVLGNEKKVQVIASFGHKTTDLLVLNHGIPCFTYSVNAGGLSLTKTLVNELSLETEQAEEYKKTYGLREDLLEGKVSKILSPVIDEVVSQINKAFLYLQQQGYNKIPDELVLSGGGALLPGLTGYLAAKLNLETVVADPFSQFIHDDEFKKRFPYETNPQWATAAGLALKGWI